MTLTASYRERRRPRLAEYEAWRKAEAAARGRATMAALAAAAGEPEPPRVTHLQRPVPILVTEEDIREASPLPERRVTLGYLVPLISSARFQSSSPRPTP